MTHRTLFLAGFVVCAALIAAALAFQHIGGLEPCPLCILQRIAFIAVGVLCLLGWLHNPRGWGRRVYGAAVAVAALLGAAVAARHIYLQNLPADQVPTCGPGLEFMLNTFPLQETLALVLRGSGECAEVDWTLLGLSMPGWALLWLLALTALGVVLIARR